MRPTRGAEGLAGERGPPGAQHVMAGGLRDARELPRQARRAHRCATARCMGESGSPVDGEGVRRRVCGGRRDARCGEAEVLEDAADDVGSIDEGGGLRCAPPRPPIKE